MLRGAGARTVRLEVAVDNDQALRVYTSVGFQPVIVEDYYLLPRPTVAIARLHRNPQAQG
jgi:ribosomal protein S18 acetylase RimI-like enzyme